MKKMIMDVVGYVMVFVATFMDGIFMYAFVYAFIESLRTPYTCEISAPAWAWITATVSTITAIGFVRAKKNKTSEDKVKRIED